MTKSVRIKKTSYLILIILENDKNVNYCGSLLYSRTVGLFTILMTYPRSNWRMKITDVKYIINVINTCLGEKKSVPVELTCHKYNFVLSKNLCNLQSPK